MAVAALGFVAGNWLFVDPRGTLLGGGDKDFVEFAFFLAICAGGILLVRRVHQREDSLRRALAEQGHTREALASSQRRFRDVLDSMTDIVFTLRPDGSAEYVNPRWGEFAGKPDADARDFEAMVAPRISRRYVARAPALASGGPSRVEFRMRGRDGLPRWFVSRTVPIRDAAGTITGWVGTVTDVHEARSAQERLEISERRYRTVSEAFDFACGAVMRAVA